MTQILIQTEYYNITQCNDNPTTLYIFGDNVVKFGKGGQATIRDCPNTFGIPTKMFPSTSIDSYFIDSNDNSYEYIDNSLIELYNIYKSNKYNTIIFPKDGLGTGLSKMPFYAPKMFKRFCEDLYDKFNIKMTDKGFE